MFTAKKPTREKLFEKAMLSRKDRIAPRRTAHSGVSRFPWVSVSLWSAFSLVGGYILFFSPALMVRGVVIEGERLFPSAEYQALVESVMENTSFGILEHQNYFFVPTDRIATSILNRYPHITNVSVEREFPDSVRVSLTESSSILLWCAGGPCYGVRAGRAVLVPFAEEERYDALRLSVIDESALPIVSGGDMLPVEPYLTSLRTAQEIFLKLGVGSLSPIARTPSRYSGELTFSTEEGWNLILSVERPAEKSLGTLRAFLAEYAKDHADRSRLASIDLRVDGKIFYAEKSTSVLEAFLPDVAVVNDKSTEKKKKKSGE